MTAYYDTGVILKLYTTERESPAVRRFVVSRKEPLHLNALHRSECVSAFRLKAFRGECSGEAAASAIADIEDDFVNGVIRPLSIDWDLAWSTCRSIADAHAAATGCRTLDTLHVACARLLGIREFVTLDKRQSLLAKRLGMRVVHPS
ncbi:MAG TPA: type II toxin-antitoxin system VapC family toxin [Oceanipulchritudo sp.]|nr:type II toxin-antitoxin system VapC family toxin [Oceanipulchritudo sp.]